MTMLLPLVLALLAALPALPARASYDENRMGSFTREREARVDPAQDFRRWADKSVARLHRDFAGTSEDIGTWDPRTRRDAGARLDALRQRLTEVQSRVVHLGADDSQDAWSARKQIRSDLKGIRRDYDGLRRDLRER